MSIFARSITILADVSTAQDVMQAYLRPTILLLSGIASLIATFFIIWGGIQYTSSAGNPEKLEHAKRILRNALIGLVLIIAAGTLSSILTHAYGSNSGNVLNNIPDLHTIEPTEQGTGIVDILIKAIVGLFKYIVESAAKPFMEALSYFTKQTSLMADNQSVFKLWLVVVGIANTLLTLMLVFIGFHIMSASALGIEEIEIKHLVPQVLLTFLVLNSSIFLIDMIISLSNVMINAINAAFNNLNVFEALTKSAEIASGMSLVALLIMVVFMVLSVILLVYYVMRLVTLYLGAILSPLIVLLALLPGFKDFVSTALKTYLATIFVLFVHVIILELAASLFIGSIQNIDPMRPNVLMSMIVGIAALITLLKTQGVMMQMSYVSAGPRALRKLGGQFVNGVSYTGRAIRGRSEA